MGYSGGCKMAALRTVMLSLLFIFCLPGSAVAVTNDEKGLNDFFKSSGLKVLHLNVRGLLSNLHSIEHLLYTYKQTDIFACTETHIGQTSDNESLYKIQGYDFVARNRHNGSGGGVGVYVKTGLEWKRRSDFEHKSTECLWIEIFFKNTKSLLIACYYRPPNTSKYLSKDFNDALNETLLSAQKENKEMILLGDFNMNYLKKDDSKEVKSVINVNGFKQMIKKPTRITQSTQTLIDIIATNNPSTISKIIVEPVSISDHELIGCVRKLNNIKYSPTTIRTRDYKNYVPDTLVKDVEQINWELLYQCKDAETAANIFTTTLQNLFDKHAPIKTKTARGKPAPWLKGDLKKIVDEKNRLLRKARKTKADEDWVTYKQARNRCNGKIKEAKRKYHRNLIDENKLNPRKFWETIKSIFPSKSKSYVPNMTKSKIQKYVNSFSNYFGTVVTELKTKVVSLSNYIWKPYTGSSKKRTEKAFLFNYVSKIFVEKQLSS